MWSIDTRDIPCLGNYAEALRIFNKTAPIRGDVSGTKPIGNRRAHHKNFRQLSNGDIVCRLYSTDVVTFHVDGSVTLGDGGWNTTSTNGFANAVLGWGSGLNCSFPAVVVTTRDKERRVYRLKEPTRFVRDGDGWCVAEPSQLGVWCDYYIDKAAAQRALRESKYDEFILWMKTREALGSAKFEGAWTRRSGLEMLLDRPTSWAELAARYNMSWTEEGLRKEIYRHYNCIRVTEREWIHVSEWSPLLRRERKWG